MSLRALIAQMLHSVHRVARSEAGISMSHLFEGLDITDIKSGD